MDQAQRATQTESTEVLYEVADHIAVVTLNAPERMNTISGPMLNDLTRLLIIANEDRDVRCVILTGNGRAFCAGLDLRKERSGENPHLGLGLYIVRLIAEFHGGRVSARNWTDNGGVIIEIRLATTP